MKAQVKTLLASFTALLAACSTMPGSGEQTRFETLAAQRSETTLMQELACNAQAWLEGKNETAAKCLDRSEGAMDVLDVNPGLAATEVMARLSALRLDAALSEGRECMIVRRGKRILPFLKRLDPVGARAGCAALLERLRESSQEFPGVEPRNVCNTEADIARIRDEHVRKIEAGEQCWPWLFN